MESTLLAHDWELRLALIAAKLPGSTPGAAANFDADLRTVKAGTQLRCLSREKAALSDVTFVFEGMGTALSPEGNTQIPVMNFSGWAPWISSGDLLFFNGMQLAGVVIKFDQTTRTGTAVPVSFVKQFLEEGRKRAQDSTDSVIIKPMDEPAEDPRKTVVLNSGFLYEDLKSPVVRASYGILPGRSAALVTRVFPYGGADGILFPGDVILSIDRRNLEAGSTLSEAGFGSFPAGVALTVRGIRFKKPERPPYLVLGGLVFLEANGQYLTEAAAGERFQYLESTGRYLETKGRERFVVLDRILPTKAVFGYRSKRDLLLSVNGRAVRDLPHLKSLVEQFSKESVPIVFGFESNRIVVLDPAEIRDADEEVRARHGIQYLYEPGSASGLD
ncbi:MAG: hypothetical protein HY042_09940 [Spirochaetia bacterium]|nr:hypothetical protein [Spirochaetia bacterium]